MVFKCRPGPEETEERQLSQDVRYSETDKEDLFLQALESFCELKNDMDAVYLLHDLMTKRLRNKNEGQNKKSKKIALRMVNKGVIDPIRDRPP